MDVWCWFWRHPVAHRCSHHAQETCSTHTLTMAIDLAIILSVTCVFVWAVQGLPNDLLISSSSTSIRYNRAAGSETPPGLPHIVSSSLIRSFLRPWQSLRSLPAPALLSTPLPPCSSFLQSHLISPFYSAPQRLGITVLLTLMHLANAVTQKPSSHFYSQYQARIWICNHPA